jgi:tRNA 5-methylaminomethyl-2-thiouridine biosynthesis bifunctional protein
MSDPCFAYDTLVVGAGIAGASCAYFLTQKGQRVLVLDKAGIALGGSGAAGAFVSPKIGKGGPLQQLTNEAFAFASAFYAAHFRDLYHQTGVVRLPKDAIDAQKFPFYIPHNFAHHETWDSQRLASHGIGTAYDGFYFPDAGTCDAPQICEALLEGIDVDVFEVSSLVRHENGWCVGPYRGKNLVLATGYESSLCDLRYAGIKGTWGTRGDFRSALPLLVSMHQSMSVSANLHGIIRLGATHEKSVQAPRPCEASQALSLKSKASELIETADLKLIESYCGMRAGSRDYFPLVGRVMDVAAVLKASPEVARGAKVPLIYRPDLYCCNGLGGRGFVFGPLMGKILAELIVENKPVDKRVDPDRLFYKWCRKSPALADLR